MSRTIRRVAGTILAGLATYRLWRHNREQTFQTPIASKVVIITGASSGIGEATARAFAQAGAHVVLVARREEALHTLADELSHLPGDALVLPADITVIDNQQHIVDAVMARFGRIDVLVNNAGMSLSARSQRKPERIATMVQLNLTAAIQMTQAVLPVMQQQHSGHIVNVSSISGTFPAPGIAAYGATKGGLNTYSDALRREVAHENIHLTQIMPAWTRTAMIGDMTLTTLLRAGMPPPFFNIDEPELVAGKIVDAVRYHRRRVMLGGLGALFVSQMHAVLPGWVDWFMRLTRLGPRVRTVSRHL